MWLYITTSLKAKENGSYRNNHSEIIVINKWQQSSWLLSWYIYIYIVFQIKQLLTTAMKQSHRITFLTYSSKKRIWGLWKNSSLFNKFVEGNDIETGNFVMVLVGQLCKTVSLFFTNLFLFFYIKLRGEIVLRGTLKLTGAHCVIHLDKVWFIWMHM